MAFNLALALKLGDFVSRAYDACNANSLDGHVPAGYRNARFFYADDLTAPAGVTMFRCFGFVAESDADVVVAIRGTEGVFEWIGDFEFGLVSSPDMGWRGKTESGFTSFYRSFGMEAHAGAQSLREYLVEMCAGRPLYISGHSLGSALATLLAADLAGRADEPTPTLYTFASPAVGDKVFAGSFDQQIDADRVADAWRIVNHSDIVPKLPPEILGYSHVDNFFPINSDMETKHTVACWHSLMTYLHMLDSHIPLLPSCVR